MTRTEREIKAFSTYKSISEFIREDIVEASAWARKTLTDFEGSGHEIFVTAAKDGLVQCSFAKPSWAGDHSGRPMEHGAQAIVMAVCEYLEGL